MNMSEIKARILETKTKEEGIAYEYGNKAGKAWVTKSAHYSELEMLSELSDATSVYDVVNAITGGDRIDPEHIGLDSGIDESLYVGQIVDGFIDGALELYREAMAA